MQHEQGSTNRPGQDLDRVLTSRGYDLEVEAQLHQTILRVTCFPQDLTVALSLLIDPLRQLLMSDAALTAARQEARLRSGNDRKAWRDLLSQGAAKALLDGHYGFTQRFVAPESLAAVDITALRQYHELAVQGSNIHLAVYGSIDEATLRKELEEQLSIEPTFVVGNQVDIQAAPFPEDLALAPVSLAWDQDRAAVALVWRGLTRDQSLQEGIALDVLAELLVGDQGLLTQRLQLRKLSYKHRR